MEINKSIKGEETYSIYIAGIVHYATSADIKRYFSSFGKIERISTFEDRSQNWASTEGERSAMRGFCIISTKSLKTFQSIMNAEEHWFMGRRLNCQEYVQGEDLQSHNKMLNDRRVVLKQVPLSIDEKKLKHTLESIAGEIEMFFTFRSSLETKKSKRNLTCSAMFKSTKDAQKLIELGGFPGPDGRPINIRKYEHQARTHFTEKESQNLRINARKNNQVLDQDLWVRDLPKSDIKSKDKLTRQNRQRGTKADQSVDSNPTRTCRLANFHSQKPTSSSYYSYRSLMTFFKVGNSGNLKSVRFNKICPNDSIPENLNLSPEIKDLLLMKPSDSEDLCVKK